MKYSIFIFYFIRVIDGFITLGPQILAPCLTCEVLFPNSAVGILELYSLMCAFDCQTQTFQFARLSEACLLRKYLSVLFYAWFFQEHNQSMTSFPLVVSLNQVLRSHLLQLVSILLCLMKQQVNDLLVLVYIYKYKDFEEIS